MEKRPKLNLTLSKLDRTLENLSKFFLATMLVLTVYAFLKLPSEIPIHFGDTGNPDKFGKKATLLIFPILGSLVYLMLTQIAKYPEIFNYLTPITIDNARQQYTNATRIIRFLKLAILLIFTFIIGFTYLTSVGITNGLGASFIPVVLGITLIPTVILIAQGLTIKKNLS